MQNHSARAGETFWNIETNEQKKVAGPYATAEHALQARWYFPTVPKLYVVEYQTDDCPARANFAVSP